MKLGGSQIVLPSNLLIVWKRKGLIQPRFAKPTVENLKVAGKLIDLFRNGAGKKKRALKQVADELEVEGFDYRFVRALFLLLDRRSVFGCHSPMDPQELRRKIFHVTGENGPATSVEQRNSVMKNMASQLKVSSEKLEEMMYADLNQRSLSSRFQRIGRKSFSRLRSWDSSMTSIKKRKFG
jgi:predicted nuclease of restriction endonuclease-like RecB superfamily